MHAQFRRSTRKNVAQAARELGRGTARLGQFCAAGVSRFCAWICEIAYEFSTECCNHFPPTVSPYCRRKEFVSILQKLEEKLCAGEFQPSETRKTRTQSGWRSRSLLVPSFRGLEGTNSLAHSFSQGFCKMLTIFFRRQYFFTTSDKHISDCCACK